jgi:hypothetical protein
MTSPLNTKGIILTIALIAVGGGIAVSQSRSAAEPPPAPAPVVTQEVAPEPRKADQPSPSRTSMGIPAEDFYQRVTWQDQFEPGLLKERKYKTEDGVRARFYRGSKMKAIIEEDGNGNASYVWAMITTMDVIELKTIALRLFHPVHHLKEVRDLNTLIQEANDFGQTLHQFGPNNLTIVWKDKTKGVWEMTAKSISAPDRSFPPAGW